MTEKLHEKLRDREMKVFSLFSILLLLVGAFAFEPPRMIAKALLEITTSRDALITDYFELAGYGASFFNAACVLGIAVALIQFLKIPFTGLTMAALFINAGYAFWGKNVVNILPILFGTFLYAKVHRAGMNRYIYTALFGTCLSPFVTEMVSILPYSDFINILFAVILGIFIGFVLPPLSMHTASMHMGYNLLNVGFSAGLLSFVIACVLESVGLKSEAVMIWKQDRHPGILIGLYAYFIFTILYGFFVNRGTFKGFRKLMSRPGRAVSDFVMMDGVGATLINMGLMGLLCTTYILLIGGDISGPVLGAILTTFGFSAFGAHPLNYMPVLIGVYFSTLFTRFEASTPGIQLAAIFAAGLAPIAGQFGWLAGVAAGLLHAIIVMFTSEFNGGLNLYNNGFSAGWVAIVMIPVLESFTKRVKVKGSTKKVREEQVR